MGSKPDIEFEKANVYIDTKTDLLIYLGYETERTTLLKLSYKDPGATERSSLSLYLTNEQLSSIEQAITDWWQACKRVTDF